MMNCLNCGAPFDPDLEKCPYCGTSYYDMSALTVDGKTPFMLKLKVPYGDRYLYITQLVIAHAGNIEISNEAVDCYDGIGNRLTSFTKSTTVTTNIEFNTIDRKNGTMFTANLKEN